MRTIRTTEELDAIIEECNEAERRSDDAMRAVFGTFRMNSPTDLPADPFSEAYWRRQMDLYTAIAGRPYDTANEVTTFDVPSAVHRPFPFYTGSTRTTGEHLMAIGLLLRIMDLRPASRVLEFGPGWGNTTLVLAKLGHRVTAVDIESHFCELLRRRAAAEHTDLEVVQADFLWAETQERQFDLVLFFECFHHCADPMRLLRALDRVVAPGGTLIFGAEPISDDFPMPWGIRLDGSSLWAIRKNGWLELGFQDSFFREALRRAGWIGERIPCADLPWLNAWRASRLSEFALRFPADSPQICTQTGEKRDGVIRLSGKAGTGLFGPYVSLPRGRYVATITFAASPPWVGSATMDVCVGVGAKRLAERKLSAGPGKPSEPIVSLPFEAADDVANVEVRLFCEAGFAGDVAAVSIDPLL